MKKVFILLLVVLIGLIATDCKKKNYPKDIPKWLKEKIDEMNKDIDKTFFFSRERRCRYPVKRQVVEYNDGSSTYYWIGSSYGAYTIFNYSGDIVCQMYSYAPPPCGNLGYGARKVRTVWVEDCSNG